MKYFKSIDRLFKNGDLVEVQFTTVKEIKIAVLVRVINNATTLELETAVKLVKSPYGDWYGREELAWERRQTIRKHLESLYKLIRVKLTVIPDSDLDYFERLLTQENLKRNNTPIFYNRETTGRYEQKYDYFIIEDNMIVSINWIMKEYVETGYGDGVHNVGFNLLKIR